MSGPTLHHVAGKLAVLIPRLDSDKDGEVVATVRAIGRQLERAGADWHDLAAAVSRVAADERQGTPQATDWRAAIEWIMASGLDLLSENEREFVVSMRGILARFPSPTPKQATWLNAILAKTCGAP